MRARTVSGAAGVLAETLETATNWANLPRLDAAVRSALTAAPPAGDVPHLARVPGRSVALLHRRVRAGARPDRPAGYRQTAAGDNITAAGGTITHHHAVGTDHRHWMNTEIGDLGADVLHAVKATLDPAGVLNPANSSRPGDHQLPIASPLRHSRPWLPFPAAPGRPPR